MEYVAGRTLRDILREGRKILPERALEITSGVLSALDYSHRAGIIHRDIKPGNVMLTPSGDVKVMDFGIARAISDASSTMTQTAAVVGTAQYLSPEQARGETVDSRSDVYSAGCLLYELLTGRPPFVGDSPVAVAYQHVREPAAPPSDHDTELPADDRRDRDEVARQAGRGPLPVGRRDAQRHRALPRRPAGPRDAAAAAPGRRPDDGRRAGRRDRRRATAQEDDDERGSRTGLWILLGLLLVLLIGGAAYLLPADVRVAARAGPGPRRDRRDARTRPAPRSARPGFEVEVTSAPTTTCSASTVLEQDPNADQYVDARQRGHLVVSEGRPLADVPYVLDQPRVGGRASAGEPRASTSS